MGPRGEINHAGNEIAGFGQKYQLDFDIGSVAGISNFTSQ